MTVAIGPGFAGFIYRGDHELDTSLRVVIGYDIGTDGFSLRLDTKKDGVQMNNGLYVGSPQRGSDLVMPQQPAYTGFSVRANGVDLVAMLRDMADRLEQQLKEDAEKIKS